MRTMATCPDTVFQHVPVIYMPQVADIPRRNLTFPGPLINLLARLVAIETISCVHNDIARDFIRYTMKMRLIQHNRIHLDNSSRDSIMNGGTIQADHRFFQAKQTMVRCCDLILTPCRQKTLTP